LIIGILPRCNVRKTLVEIKKKNVKRGLLMPIAGVYLLYLQIEELLSKQYLLATICCRFVGLFEY
jgi:hypothetical protein